MLANYHTHTARCQHAVGEDREYVECAIAGGIQVLGFSDHCPWVNPNGYVSGIRMTPEQLDGYVTSLTDLKREYADDIQIYIGLEAEYIPERMEAQDALLRQYPIDYMILGQHFLGLEEEGIYSSHETTEEAQLRQYVDLVIAGMESGRYRYVAHPDLLHYVGSEETYKRHMTRLCQYLKQKEIPVEINMLGLLEKRHYPCAPFLHIAQQLGNTAIIGYDAHQPERLTRLDARETCRQLAEQYTLPLVESLPGLE